MMTVASLLIFQCSGCEVDMEIMHHGAVNGVTGSCHELQLDANNSILIDCGLFQGDEHGSDYDQQQHRSDDTLESHIPFPITAVKALVVTHVHIDHVGRIPYLLAAGFNGPIFCTEASAILLPLVLEDALKVGFTRNQRLIKQVMKKIKSQIVALPYGCWHKIEEMAFSAPSSLQIKFQPAGHILGSAYVLCRYHDENKHKTDVLFSGDLGATFTPLLPAAKSPYACDVLVIESTYGDSLHENRKGRKKQLQSSIEKAVADNGVVLIPAFSIGRTQELLYEIESIIHANHSEDVWQDIEIIIDSPLAAKFNHAYRSLKPLWDKEAHKTLSQGRHPLSFEQLYTVDSHREHLQSIAYLQKRKKPAIIIAASGMCAGGRIMNYLKAFIENASTDILLVGYQASGTPGRALQKYAARNGYVELDGNRYNIMAQVKTLSGYSAHADQANLFSFVKGMKNKPSHIRIVHGNEKAKAGLKHLFEKHFKQTNVLIP